MDSSGFSKLQTSSCEVGVMKCIGKHSVCQWQLNIYVPLKNWEVVYFRVTSDQLLRKCSISEIFFDIFMPP